MIGRLLCRLGLHNYGYELDRLLTITFVRQCCQRCGKLHTIKD
jgi:hypothetical protein